MEKEADGCTAHPNHGGSASQESAGLFSGSASQGYVGLFFATLKALKGEEHVKATERGHHVITLTTLLQQQESHTASVDFAVHVCTRLIGILDTSKHTRRLPTAIMGRVWGSFVLAQPCAINGPRI